MAGNCRPKHMVWQWRPRARSDPHPPCPSPTLPPACSKGENPLQKPSVPPIPSLPKTLNFSCMLFVILVVWPKTSVSRMPSISAWLNFRGLHVLVMTGERARPQRRESGLIRGNLAAASRLVGRSS